METITTLLLFICTTVLIALFTWVRHRMSYWSRKGIPASKFYPLVGSHASLILKNFTVIDYQMDIYGVNMESKYIGMMIYNTPAILLKDPELIREIGIRRFEEFPDHIPLIDKEADPFFGRILFFARGDKWKEMNAAMKLAHNPSKIKMMFEFLTKTGKIFISSLLENPEFTSSIKMEDALARFTADVIAGVSLGLNIKSTEYKDEEFFTNAKATTKLGKWHITTRVFIAQAFPRLARWWGVSLISKNAAKFFKDLITTNLAARKEQNIVRSDLIHLLTEARDKKNGIEIEEADIIAQSYNSFFSGFETSSTLMCFVAYELALNPEIQERLRKEVDQCFDEGKGVLTYELINGLKYMSNVFAETLRKYPTIPISDRICRKTFELPPAVPGADPFVMEPNMEIYLPIHALHHDPKYFPEPEKFDPERFNEQNRSKIVPYSYLPFGVGPRACPARQFGLIMNKIIVAHLLSKFVIKPTAKTQIPLKLDSNKLNLSSERGIWLELMPRTSACAF